MKKEKKGYQAIVNYSRKIFIIAFITFGLLNVGVTTVWSHPDYLRSDPPASSSFKSGQAPRQVQVWFSEELEPQFSELQVLNQQRQRVDNGDSRVLKNEPGSMLVTLQSNLPDGVYRVLYKIISNEDGHVIKNSFAFLVGAGTLPKADIGTGQVATSAEGGEDDNFNFWSVVLRWLNYLSATLLFGGAGWWLLVWKPALRKVRGQLGLERAVIISRIAQQRSNLLLFIAFGGLSLGWVGWLLYQGTHFGGISLGELFSSPALGDILFKSRFGTVWLTRLAVLLLTAWILLFMITKISLPRLGLPRRTRFNLMPEFDPPSTSAISEIKAGPTRTIASEIESPPGTGPKSFYYLAYWLLMVCGAQLMFSALFNSHARSDPTWLLLPAHWLHLMATGLWVGGLCYLVLVLLPVLATLPADTDDRRQMLVALLPNFSRLAIISILVLLVTGTIQSVVHLGSFDRFFSTDYGRVLFIKLLLVGLLLLLGAYHLLKISPAMPRLAQPGQVQNELDKGMIGRLQLHFRRTIKVEALLAIALLGVVGGLTSLGPPARSDESNTSYIPPYVPGGIILSGQTADLNYILRVDPAKAGYNNFDLTLVQSDGLPVKEDARVVLRLNLEESNKNTTLQEVGFEPEIAIPGYYQAYYQNLSIAGQWQAELTIRREGKEEVRTKISFRVD